MQDEPLDEFDKWIEKVCAAQPLPAYEDEDLWPSGPSLNKYEIKVVREQLAKWQQPDAFKCATRAIWSRCKAEEWFNRLYLKFLHDAYVLAEFASLWPAESVRLASASEQWPDGNVKIAGINHLIEVTSTHGGRKLGEEYRGPQMMTMDRVENWVARAESIPRYLDEAIHAKRRRNYSSPCWLVVYLNIGEYGIRQIETERSIEVIKQRYSSSFEAITVLWKGKLY